MIEKGLSTPAPEEIRVALPTISLKEITPHPKKCSAGDKWKEKVGVIV